MEPWTWQREGAYEEKNPWLTPRVSCEFDKTEKEQGSDKPTPPRHRRRPRDGPQNQHTSHSSYQSQSLPQQQTRPEVDFWPYPESIAVTTGPFPNSATSRLGLPEETRLAPHYGATRRLTSLQLDSGTAHPKVTTKKQHGPPLGRDDLG